MNAKKLLSTLMSAAMAVTMLAGCFGGGGSNYSRQAADAANAAQSTVVFSTDSALANSLQDALEDYIQPADIKAAMTADESMADLLTSGYVLDIYFTDGEQEPDDAAKAIAAQLGSLSGRDDEGKIAMVKAENNYYYAAVLTYRTGNGSGSGSGEGGQGGTTPGGDDNPSTDPDDDENNESTQHYITVTWEGNGSVYDPDGNLIAESGAKIPVDSNETVTFSFEGDTIIVKADQTGTEEVLEQNSYSFVNVTADRELHIIFAHTITVNVQGESYGQVSGPNGELSGSIASVIVKDGDDAKFTFDADDWGKIDSIEIDGSSETLSSSHSHVYTDPSVDENYTISVDFVSAVKQFEVSQKKDESNNIIEDGILHVNEKLTGDHLTVEVFDDNYAELDLELTYVSATPDMFDTTGKHRTVVVYRDAKGNTYTDYAVDITVTEAD